MDHGCHCRFGLRVVAWAFLALLTAKKPLRHVLEALESNRVTQGRLAEASGVRSAVTAAAPGVPPKLATYTSRGGVSRNVVDGINLKNGS